MKTMQEMNTREFLRFARRQARASFKGIAITSTATASAVPADLDDDLRFAMLADRVTMDDGSEAVRSEKILPFNRKTLMNPPPQEGIGTGRGLQHRPRRPSGFAGTGKSLHPLE